MRIAIGADHAGFTLKNDLAAQLTALGVPYTDFGTHGTESVDYPDFAAEVALAVASGAYDRGLLVCGSGIGMAMAANKIAGIRAASVTDTESAKLSRSHNDANVLALGARLTAPELAHQILKVFLDTPFDGGRHVRRIAKITQLDGSAPKRNHLD